MTMIRFTKKYQGEMSNSKAYSAGDVADFPEPAAHAMVERECALFDHKATATVDPPWPPVNHPWLPQYVATVSATIPEGAAQSNAPKRTPKEAEAGKE